MRAGMRAMLPFAVFVFAAGTAHATVEMQVQAKRLGLPVGNCLYCHASAHSVETMKARAKALNMSDGNCLACHGANIPARLNERGHWLASEKTRRGAKQFDMAWLRDYKEPAGGAPVAKRPKP